MSALVAVALAASWGSALERHRRLEEHVSLEGLVLVTTAWSCAVAIVTTLLAVAGLFSGIAVAGMSVLGALLCWPWGRSVPSPKHDARAKAPRWIAGLVPLVLLMLGLGLRWPVLDFPLAGRDQGTYTLRAQHTLRTGGLHAIDPVLAIASEQRDARPGPADLRGLYHHEDEPWRRDLYEAAYRPGFYLADLDRGLIRPQFLHAHPMLMATAGLVLGPQHVAAVTLLYAGLTILAMLAIARRLWGRGVWAGLAAFLWATSPLSIWVLRTPLSEGPAAMLVLSTVLAVLRARDQDPRALYLAALSMGTLAWVRGNGWLAAPILLAAQWLVPTTEPTARRASLWLALLVGAAVLVHAPTTFPYLYDELLRQLPMPATMTPGLIIGTTLAGLALWGIGWALCGWGKAMRRRHAHMLAGVARVGPGLLVLLLLAAVVAYVALRVEPLAKPFSRLDPVLPVMGIPMLVVATVGLSTTLRRWPTRPSAAQAWMLGLGGVLVVTVGLYAQRNLPQLTLYYYGRYLVPELLPALLLLAVEGLRTLHSGLRGPATAGRRATVAAGAALAGTVGLWWSHGAVLIRHPVTRLQEFAGAARVVDHIAAKLPEGAIVIAGGEGWHHGHTFNQVGGALAFRHGVAVLPYLTREAAYASLVELLMRRPAATAEPPAPVYLLINEATKNLAREPKSTASPTRISAVDDLLPPPFVARRIDLVEMFLDRLTPVRDRLPLRVTRDGLRMALLEVMVDEARMSEVESWRVEPDATSWPLELSADGGEPPCLGPEPLTLTLPPEGNAGTGPVSLVLVAAPGTAAHNGQWSLEIDGHVVVLDRPRATPRDRDTLGPVSLSERPRRIRLRGAKAAVADARCPHGGLAEVHLLGPERPMLRTAAVEATTFAPAMSLGHPVEAVGWVSGRGLSRYRSGLDRSVPIEGLSLQLRPDVPLRFPAAALPDGGAEILDVVLTLTRSVVGPEARIEVTIDGESLPSIDPPEDRRGSWQSPPLPWTPSGPAARFEVTLTHAEPGASVLLRDIGLFSRAAPVRGRLVEY